MRTVCGLGRRVQRLIGRDRSAAVPIRGRRDPPAGRRPPPAGHRPARRPAPRRRPARPGRRHHLRQRGAGRAGRVGRPGRDAAPGGGAGRRPAGRRHRACSPPRRAHRRVRRPLRRPAAAGAPRVHPVLAAGAGHLAVGHGRPGCAGNAPAAGPYRVRLVDDASPADLADAIDRTAAALAAGRPVPLLIGGFVPRHYVLALAATDAGWHVYEPGSGQVRLVTPEQLRGRALAPVLGFDRWHAVLLPGLTAPGENRSGPERRLVRVTDTLPPRSADLPAQWTPGEVEAGMYQRWVDAGYFTADVTSDKPSYCIVIPPPNVTGNLHIGHAFEHTLIDILVRRRRMQGYETLWLPGMDHASIAVHALVERALEAEGTSRRELGREAFIERTWEWKAEYGGAILAQMRRLGESVDWSRERFTMDEGLNRAVVTIFKRLYDDGLIYRAERMVNWSPEMRSVLTRHRGRAPRRRGRAGLHPLRRRRRLGGRGHHPGRDHARRHRHRGAPRRRALRAPDRPRDRAAAGRAHDQGGGRRARRPELRHRRAQDHPGARPERLRDRPPARPADADDHGRVRADRRTPAPSSTAWTATRPG